MSGQSLLQRINERGRKPFNLWIFESPKNGRRLTIDGDLNFMLCVLLEGDPSVAGYKVRPSPFRIPVGGDLVEVCPDLEVERRDGSNEWWEVTRSTSSRSKAPAPPSVLAGAAEPGGAVYVKRTERDVAGKAVAFDNWLLLCAAMTRARHYPSHREARVLRGHLDSSGKVSVRELLQQDGIDRALMVATIARFLQAGRVSANLDTRLFSEETLLVAEAV